MLAPVRRFPVGRPMRHLFELELLEFRDGDSPRPRGRLPRPRPPMPDERPGRLPPGDSCARTRGMSRTVRPGTARSGSPFESSSCGPHRSGNAERIAGTADGPLPRNRLRNEAEGGQRAGGFLRGPATRPAQERLSIGEAGCDAARPSAPGCGSPGRPSRRRPARSGRGPRRRRGARPGGGGPRRRRGPCRRRRRRRRRRSAASRRRRRRRGRTPPRPGSAGPGREAHGSRSRSRRRA